MNMSNILIHPSYFGTIAQYIPLINAPHIVFEKQDSYQKQTYRNRTYIYGANGKLLLNIPIIHKASGEKSLDASVKRNRQSYTDIRIDHQFKSLAIHWKSLEAAYRSSPYFEFYEDQFQPLFEGKPESLYAFNIQCMQTVFDALGVAPEISYTESYEFTPDPELYKDYRYLVNAKNQKLPIVFEKYTQVFENKSGFIENLSILDLIFNEGPAAVSYLEKYQDHL